MPYATIPTTLLFDPGTSVGMTKQEIDALTSTYLIDKGAGNALLRAMKREIRRRVASGQYDIARHLGLKVRKR